MCLYGFFGFGTSILHISIKRFDSIQLKPQVNAKCVAAAAVAAIAYISIIVTILIIIIHSMSGRCLCIVCMSGGRLHVIHDIDRPNWDQSKWPYYLNAFFCLSDSCIAYVQAIFLSYTRAGDLCMTALKRNSFKHYSLQRFYCITSFKSHENNIATVEHAKRSIIWVFAIISHQFVCSIRKQFRHAHDLSNQNLLIIIIAIIQLYWWLNGPFFNQKKCLIPNMWNNRK